MTHPPVAVESLGDRGLLVRFTARPSRKLTELLVGFCAAVREIDGVVDAAPGHRTALIEADPRAREVVAAKVPYLVGGARPSRGATREVAIRYDGEDLGWVCSHLGIAPEDLVRLHSAKIYDVRLIGSPGFIYLSPVAREIAVPRREEPRQSVPAGSVGIGGKQTGIYGRPRPGGWRLIGTVPEVPRVLPGDRIRFLPA